MPCPISLTWIAPNLRLLKHQQEPPTSPPTSPPHHEGDGHRRSEIRTVRSARSCRPYDPRSPAKSAWMTWKLCSHPLFSHTKDSPNLFVAKKKVIQLLAIQLNKSWGDQVSNQDSGLLDSGCFWAREDVSGTRIHCCLSMGSFVEICCLTKWRAKSASSNYPGRNSPKTLLRHRKIINFLDAHGTLAVQATLQIHQKQLQHQANP